MSKIQEAVNIAIGIANDNHHGYSQARRNGGIDYDCSTVVLFSLKSVGIKTGSASYTGNMLRPLLDNGFIDVKGSVDVSNGNGLLVGDILLKPKTDLKNGHTAFYIGNGKIVQANGDYDGKLGDSSGREITVQKYYNSGWKHVLRYTKDTPNEPLTEGLLFAVKLKEDMNVRVGSGTAFSAVQIAKKGLVLGISEVSKDGRWGRIQNQRSSWICIAPRYVDRV